MKLTDETVRNLTVPPGKTEHWEWDDKLRRFGVRLRAGSADPIFYIQYRDRARATHKIKIGSASVFTTVKARAAAVTLLNQADLARNGLGEDPQKTKLAARIKDPNTLGAAVKIYLAERDCKVGTKGNRALSLAQIKYYLSSETGPRRFFHSLYDKPIKDITVSDLAFCLSDIRAKSGQRTGTSGLATGNEATSKINLVFSWAIKRRLIEWNPVTALDRAKLPPRTRWLKEDEIRELWAALSAPSKSKPTSHYFKICKILLLTGARKMMIGNLCWSDIDFEKRQITISRDRMKTWKEHVIPLTDPVIKILQSIERHDGNDHVFPWHCNTPRGGRWNFGKTRVDAHILRKRQEKSQDAKPMEDWTPHDFRRTLTTIMAERHQIPRDHIDAVLSHAVGNKVSQTYNRYDYLREMRDVLTLWGNLVMNLVGEGDDIVVPFVARQAS